MAQGRNQLEIDVVANIRAAQKQIEALVSKPYTLNFSSKGGGFAAPLGKIKGQLGEFEKSLEASNARVIAFGASASAIYAVEKALSESVKAAIEVEKALKDINVILNLTDKSLSSFGTSLFNIAKNTGNAFSTVASAATELSRQGLGVAETLKRTQDALILTRLSGLGAVDSVEAITAALNGFQKTALSSTVVINKLAAVDASFAVSSGDLADAIKRVGSSAEDAGVSFDELLAIVTSAQQITARGGAVIGNSFKTIFTRLQRPKVLEDLQQLGIQTQTAAGNTRPLIQILSDLAKTYDTLNDRQKASIAETVGGVFQINVLKAALGDLNKEYSIFSNALQVSTGATDEAIRRNEELNTTLASLLNKTIANLTAAGAKIGELSLAPALKKVFGGLNSILENIGVGDSEDIGSQIGEGLLRGIGNFLSGPGLIVGAKALFTIFERLTVFTADAAKTILNLNTKTAEQAQLQQQIFNVLSKDPAIIAQLTSGQTTLKDIQESILTTIKAQTLAMEQQVTLSKTLAASLSAAGVSVSKTGPTSGRLQVKSGGFVPNLFGQEERSARGMGAVNPRAQISQGTIGGQKFIKNNKEVEIVGMGSNGDSAVIPTYGSVGDKRQKELYDKLNFLGFVPNFAKTNQEEMQKNIYAAYRKINPAMLIAEGDQSVGSLKYKDATLQYPIIPLSKAGVESEKSIYQQFSSKEAIDQISRMVLDGATNYINSIGYKPPAKQITTDSLVGLFSKNSKYKGAYGALQAFIGAAFEVGTGEALGVSAAASDGGDFDVRNSSNIAKVRKYFPGNYNVADFKVSGSKTNRGSMSDKIKKDLDKLLPNLDIIRQGEKEAIKGKSLSSAKKTLQEYRQNLLVGDQRTVTKRNPSGTSPLDKLIAAKKAKGFTPNFAGIRTAMQTEKKMGGNPALDFQEGIGLYVRDKNTQSNFSAVKKDHPEGIGQAMKNSQKAQESLARGFIPNFAPKQGLALGGEMQSLKGLFDDAKIGPALKGVKNNAFQASIALSTLSGVVDTFNKDSQSKFGSVVSAATQAAGTFASIATVVPGPIGLFVGAAVGAYQAFESISQILRDETGPIKKSLEKTKEETSKLNDASQAYAATFEKLQGSYKEPQGTPEEAAKTQMKYQNDLAKALQDLPSAYREQIASAKNLTEVQTKIAEALAEQNKKEKQDRFGLGVAEAIKTGEKINPEKLIKDAFGASTPEQQQAFTEKFKQGDVSGMQRFMGSTVVGTKAGPKELEGALGQLGLDPKNIALVMKEGEGQTRALFDALREMGVELEKSSKKSKELADQAAETQKANADAAEKERLKAEATRKSAEAAAISAEANRASAVAELKLASIRKSNISKIANAAASSELQTAEPFTTAKGMAVGQAAIEQSTRINAAQADKAQAGAGAIDAISANFANSIQKQIDDELGKASPNQEAVNKLQTEKAKVAKIVGEGGTPKEISDKLEQLGKDLNLGDIGSLQSQTLSALQGMNESIALVDEELKTSNTIAAKQLQEQIKQIRNQERTKALGGMQGFLNPETLKEPVEKLLGGFQKAQTGKKYGLENTAARGFAEAGMATLELTGGAGSSDVNAALKESVVPQQTKFIEQTFKDLAAQSRATGTPEGEKLAKVFDSQAADAGNIAAAQFDAAFQKEQLPQNVAKILAEVTKIASGDNTSTSVEQGIKDAEKTGTGPNSVAALSGLSRPPTTATTLSGKPLFAEKETSTGTQQKEAKPKGVTLPDGTFIANQPTKPLMNTNTSQVPTSTVNGAANQVAAREFKPNINKPLGIGEKGALTPAEADKYLSANMSEQDSLRQKAADLSVKAAKGDKGSQVELQKTKEKLSGLSERYKSAEETKTTLGYQERPVQAGAESMAQKLGRSRAEMQFGDVNRERRDKEAADRALGPQENKGNQTSTSKGEVNVSFTPISIDLKGSIETANDELNEKMTDAIKQAVEQLAPGIISKIYGPPRDKPKT
jgi:TP901 family phage tail tape measure protein